MKKKQFQALIALNVFLLIALAAVTLAPAAAAQRASRAPGAYTMLSGSMQGKEESAIYIIDANNQELVGLRWDNSRRGFLPLGYRSLRDDAARPAGVGR